MIVALQKSETIYNNKIVLYHRVVHLEVDMATGACTAVLHSWPSRQDREFLRPPDLNRRFNFVHTGTDLLADAYAAIKSLPYWADAEDV